MTNGKLQAKVVARLRVIQGRRNGEKLHKLGKIVSNSRRRTSVSDAVSDGQDLKP